MKWLKENWFKIILFGIVFWVIGQLILSFSCRCPSSMTEEEGRIWEEVMGSRP